VEIEMRDREKDMEEEGGAQREERKEAP